jgi:hypothetical protein
VSGVLADVATEEGATALVRATPGEMIHHGMTKTAQLAVSRALMALTKGTKDPEASPRPVDFHERPLFAFGADLHQPQNPPVKDERQNTLMARTLQNLRQSR